MGFRETDNENSVRCEIIANKRCAFSGFPLFFFSFFYFFFFFGKREWQLIGLNCLSVVWNQSSKIIFLRWWTKSIKIRIGSRGTFWCWRRWRFIDRLTINIFEPIVARQWGVIVLTWSIFRRCTSHRHTSILHHLREMANIVAVNSIAFNSILSRRSEIWNATYISSGNWLISDCVVFMFSLYHIAMDFSMAVLSSYDAP